MFERVNHFFERAFATLFERSPTRLRIRMEPVLRVDGSGRVRVVRVPTDEPETNHDQAGT